MVGRNISSMGEFSRADMIDFAKYVDNDPTEKGIAYQRVFNDWIANRNSSVDKQVRKVGSETYEAEKTILIDHEEPIKPESEWLECEMCKEVNETVQWVTDRYELEVHDVHTSICVCNTCENDRAGEV